MSLEELAGLIFGPWGAAIGLLILTIFLAREYRARNQRLEADHEKRDLKLETQLERAENIADVAVAGWREQTAASSRSAEGNEKSALAIEAIRNQLAEEAESRRLEGTAPGRRRTR